MHNPIPHRAPVVDLPADHPLVKSTDGLARASRHAAEVDRTIRTVACVTGEDPAGFAVLVPGSPEHRQAERDLMRARAL